MAPPGRPRRARRRALASVHRRRRVSPGRGPPRRTTRKAADSRPLRGQLLQPWHSGRCCNAFGGVIRGGPRG
eukprot:1969899-Alexandrium_andersonii.AAC.1